MPLQVPLLVAGDGSVADAAFNIENKTKGASVRVSQISFTKGAAVAQVSSYGSVTTQRDTVGMQLSTSLGGSANIQTSAQTSLDAAKWTIQEGGTLGMTLKTKIGGYGNLNPVAKTPIGKIAYTFSVVQ